MAANVGENHAPWPNVSSMITWLPAMKPVMMPVIIVIVIVRYIV